MSNASKSFTSMQATRSHRRDVNGMVGQWSTFNQMRTFLREICVPLQPADPLKSTASAALQNRLMFQPHSESTSFTSMGSLVRVQLSPPQRSPCKSRAAFFFAPRPHRRGVHFFQGSPRRRERLGPPFRSHGRLAQLLENRGGFVGGINWLCKFPILLFIVMCGSLSFSPH